MRRSISIMLRLFAAFIGGIVAACALLIWWLNTNPVNATYLTPYIEEGIDHYLPGTHTQIAHTATEWDNVEHVIALHVDDLNISDKDNQIIASVPHMDIQLSALGLLARQFLPLSLNIEQPDIKLVRDGNGIMRFGGIQADSGNNSSQQNTNIKDALAPVLDDLAHAFRTRKLSITGVKLDVHDSKTQSDWTVHVPEISIEHSLTSLSGHALLDVTQKDQVSTLQVKYSYDGSKAQHKLETQLTAITPAFFAGGHPGTLGLNGLQILDLPLTGSVETVFDSSLNLALAVADVHGDAGHINYPDFWDQPRAVKSVDIKASYDRDAPQPGTLSLAADFDGPALSLTGKASPGTTAGHDLDFEFAVELNDWPMDQFADLWPKPIIASPRTWISTNLSKGNFDHGEGVFKGYLAWNDIDNLTISEASGKLAASGARINYLDGLSPVEGVNAKAEFDLAHMDVDISGGGIGSLRLQPFTIAMTDLDKDVQNISIPVNFRGPIPDILKLIDAPRLGYATALGLKPDSITGDANGVVELRLPLLSTVEMKDVDIKGHADATDAASSQLVKKIDIIQGNVKLDLTKDGLGVKGTATINKIPVQITWQENFKSVAGKPLRSGNITSVLSNDQWKLMNIEALKGSSGPVLATIDVQQMAKESTKLSGVFDLTSAEIHIDQLNWKKPPRVPALLKTTIDIPVTGPIAIKSIDLSGQQISIQGKATLSPDGDSLQSATLDSLIMGRTNATLTYAQKNDEDHTLRFEAEGKSLDVTGLKGGHEVAASDPRPKEYHIHVDKLYTSDTGLIANAEGYAIRDPQGWREISLKGLADGQVPLTIDLGTKDGKRHFMANCDDFGRALKGLGMTDTVRDGKIQIVGQNTADNPRAIEGFVKISHFTVKDLPALVILLNATSPFGFQNLLSGNMDFDRLKGNFLWQGDIIELQDVHIPGSAVGMDVAGKIDMNAGTANLHGVVAPFSMVNNILGAIPLLGDVLTGGNGGGVLAVAYTITGDLNNPNVSVNPASLLTPGFLRNLFFGDSDEADSAPDASIPTGAQPPEPPAAGTQNNFNKKP